MTAVTRQNSDNATQADLLVKDANTIVEKASGEMGELTLSMGEFQKPVRRHKKL